MLKKGDKVYHVIPPDAIDQAIVQARTVTVASAKQLRIDSNFSFHCGVIFDPKTALGRDFYATPLEAVDAFERGLEVALENRKKQVVWAEQRLAEARVWLAELRRGLK